MHVRGSSLSQPQVIEALRPFIVSFWGQADNEPIPADLLPYYQATGRSSSNVHCFMLDAKGKFLHGFDGLPVIQGSPLTLSPAALASYYVREIARGTKGLSLTLPKGEAVTRLPDATDGVRLFVRLPGRQDTYGYPIVETVENRDERTLLAYPKVSRELDAAKLSRWLSLCYPPGVNEQLHPFGSVKGTLTLKPTGPNEALLSGKVRMAKSEGDYELFEGTFEAVLTYGTATTVRGALSGIYWRFDAPHNRWIDWEMTAAIESRPR
jgi:hypothetical protein